MLCIFSLFFSSGTIKSCDLMPSVGYAIISSCITFWIPGITMSAIYFRVFREANRQERAISSERKRLQVGRPCTRVNVRMYACVRVLVRLRASVHVYGRVRLSVRLCVRACVCACVP